MGEMFKVVVDGVEYTLTRDEALEAEVAVMAKEIIEGEQYIGIVDDTKTPPNLLAKMGVVHTMVPEVITCPRCGSQDTMKYGVESGVQQYICRGCHRKFNAKQAPLGMRTPAVQIGAALAMFYDGLSLAEVSRQLSQTHGNLVNPSSIYRWIQRYTKEAVERFSGYKAHTGKIWAADETVLGVRMAQTKEGSPNTIWYWDVIDEDTRFLLASHMSNTRTIRDAEALFTQARDRAVNAPRFIVTDRLRSYIDGIERVWGGDVRHIQSDGMASDTHNNVIERFHGTIKERTKVMRDLKSHESAKLIMDGWLVHYNFFRPHMSLQGRTPAEAAGIRYEVKNWTEMVKGIDAAVEQPIRYTSEQIQEIGFTVGYLTGRMQDPKGMKGVRMVSKSWRESEPITVKHLAEIADAIPPLVISYYEIRAARAKEQADLAKAQREGRRLQ